MAFLEISDAKIWFEDTEEGLPVIFVHPGSSTSACWVNQIPAFTKAGFRCITYDLRGRGRSSSVGKGPPGHLADDVVALADHLGLDRFFLVAAAYGAFGGTDFALTYPKRLVAYVVSGSHCGIETDPLYTARKNRIKVPLSLALEIRELGPSYRAENQAGVETWLQMTRSSGREEAARQTLRHTITLDEISKMQIPTLMVAGEADLLTPPPLMRLVADRIPNCTFASIREAGHAPHWERPDQWNDAVISYLKTHS